MKYSIKPIPITGFILLSVMTTLLLLSAVGEAWITHPAAAIITVLITSMFLFEVYIEGKALLTREIQPVKQSRKFYEFLAVVIGGVVTFYFSRDLALGAVVASGLIGILAHMIVPEYGVPAYCGSFVGMSSSALFFQHYEVALASIIAGVVYVLSRDVFSGFGGKLGTIAFIGASIAAFSLGREFLASPISDWTTNLWVLLFSFIAAPLTFFLSCNLKNGPVLASGAVGLLGGLILPVLFPQIGNLLAVVVICASFTGMSNATRCNKFWVMLVAGLITGILFVFTTPLLGGAGGKLGTIAFAAIISTNGFILMFQRIYGVNARKNSNPAQR
jgi:hypothetical protein